MVEWLNIRIQVYVLRLLRALTSQFHFGKMLITPYILRNIEDWTRHKLKTNFCLRSRSRFRVVSIHTFDTCVRHESAHQTDIKGYTLLAYFLILSWFLFPLVWVYYPLYAFTFSFPEKGGNFLLQFGIGEVENRTTPMYHTHSYIKIARQLMIQFTIKFVFTSLDSKKKMSELFFSFTIGVHLL